MTNDRVLVTSTFSKTADDVRALLAYRTAEEAVRCGYPLLVIDSSPCEEFRQELTKRGATLHHEEKPRMSMGAARRQAMKDGFELAGKWGCVIWLEPEKYTMVSLLEPAFDAVFHGGVDLVLVRRKSLRSYPEFQEHTEIAGNHGWEMATGKAYDMFCGVRGGNKRILPYFMGYDPTAVGASDKWDALHLPVMDMMVAGLKIAEVTVPYVHPPEQTTAESRPIDLKKRCTQLGELVDTQFVYAKRLGLFKD